MHTIYIHKTDSDFCMLVAYNSLLAVCFEKIKLTSSTFFIHKKHPHLNNITLLRLFVIHSLKESEKIK